jgi:hypothetical protein
VTARKPPGSDWESWIEVLIREGRERGEFDDLPGAGKPLTGIEAPHDELWWVRKKLQSEGVSYLPPALALRKDREDTLALVDATPSEARARRLLEELNVRIQQVNRSSIVGPPSTVMVVDVDEAMREWWAKRDRAVPNERTDDDGALDVPVLRTSAQTGRWRGRRWLSRREAPRSNPDDPSNPHRRAPASDNVILIGRDDSFVLSTRLTGVSR